MLLRAISIAFLCAVTDAAKKKVANDDAILVDPTFKFAFSPKLDWTYQTNADLLFPGQARSFEEATENIKKDLDTQIDSALHELGINTGNASYHFTGYTPTELHVCSLAKRPCARSTYIPELGAVVARRRFSDDIKGTPYTFVGRITTTDAGKATRKMWKILADAVWKNLYFVGLKLLSTVTIV